jgi:hypothetical protein
MKNFTIILSIFFLSGITLKSQVTFKKIITGNRDEIAKSVIPTRDGGYALLADTGSGTITRKWIVKTDAYGDTLWTRIFRNQGSGFYRDRELLQTSDGGYSFLIAQDDSTYLLHISEDGDSLWAHAVGRIQGYAIAPATDNGYLVGAGFGAGVHRNMSVHRLDSLGKIRKLRSFKVSGLYKTDDQML